MFKSSLLFAVAALVALLPDMGGAYQPGMELGGADCSVASLIAASRAAAETWEPSSGMTMEMKAAADAALRKSVGSSVFDERFVFDPRSTDSGAEQMHAMGAPTRVVVYWLLVPSDPDAGGRVTVLVGEGPKVLGAMGVPVCGSDGTACDFIDHETAIAAVRSLGVPEGIEPPRWKLLWQPSGYCYAVTFVLEENEDSYECEDAVVDARTGEVLTHGPQTYGKKETGESAETPN